MVQKAEFNLFSVDLILHWQGLVSQYPA